MNSIVIVKKDCYQDSVFLMQVSARIKETAGVQDATVAMGTPMNLDLLGKDGVAVAELTGVSANDMIVAVKGEQLDRAAVEKLLEQAMAVKISSGAAVRVSGGLSGAVQALPEANLVLISLPGEHAAREARRSLALGRHVMLFSDNVSVEEEIELKTLAVEKGLLMMGPDCGTAIINGKPLAFANVVRRGSIGIVGASGTGVQEVSSLIDRLGGGVSQAIGTGGRDLSEAVGGAMSLLGIEALAKDPATAVLVVVSKPPAASVKDRILAALAGTPKPCVVHMVGAENPPDDTARKVYFAASLAEAARRACSLAGVAVPQQAGQVDELVAKLVPAMKQGTELKGLFCGGTTGHEALVLLGRAGLAVKSNLHKKGDLKISGAEPVSGHVLLDLGDDIFTMGRPHPMIEPALRNERLMVEATAQTALLLFDCVLGYGSHDDPAGLLADGVRAIRKKLGWELPAVVSVTGTEGDPQSFSSQKRKLLEAGMVVAEDNCQAATAAARALARRFS